MSKYLLLWIEAPLQSWGADSSFYVRGTMPFPTKSGILGMMLCAMGKSGEQRELLNRFSDKSILTHSYGNPSINNDQAINLIDFHLVGSSFDSKDLWQKNHIPAKIDGKGAVGSGVKLTYRHYLQDKKFSVIIELPEGLEDSVEESFITPTWPIFFGRKNCTPTDFVFRGVFDSKELALTTAKVISLGKDLSVDFSVDTDLEGCDEKIILKDEPVSFGKNKAYRSREVGLTFNTA